MTDTANANAREVLDVLAARGVETFFVSPGSRNAPLLIGLESRRQLKKICIPDERTAAFAALGHSLVSRKPVALACTSGTALYDYSPAVAEAYYQHVPLIVVTADRPSQWIGQDDSQTLHQFGALSKIVKRSFDIYSDAGACTDCPGELFADEREWYANRVANEAFITATTGLPGPVHINMQFADPLGAVAEKTVREPRLVEYVPAEGRLSKNHMEMLAARVKGKRILVVAGFMPPQHSLHKALARFVSLPNVALMSETISNLHLGVYCHMVDTLLSRLTTEETKEIEPDIVITIGGALVSRMLKEFLRRCDRAEHWTLDDTDVSADCLQRLTLHADCEPAAFFSGMAGAVRRLQKQEGLSGDALHYGAKVSGLQRRKYAESREELGKAPWSELKALAQVFDWIPEDYNLFLSNGTVIRYAQILSSRLPHGSYCNRGVSGIDGSNATALGCAMAYKGTTLLITGDMSFAYCPEVMGLASLGGDLRIILVNNSGGGIFRFIKTTRDLPMREKCFCAPHDLPAKELAEAYGWRYRKAADEEELTAALACLKGNANTLVEITADKETSATALIGFLKAR